jgi:Ala-tRNA(Pro) deacylase
MASDTAPNDHATPGIHTLERWLLNEAVEHRVIEHAPTIDARTEASASWVPAEQTAKTLVLCDREKVVLVALPASDRLDLHKLRTSLGCGQSLRLASEIEIAARFPSYEVGAIPPLGPACADVHVVDRRLLTYNRVLCGGGDHRHSILLDAMDLVRASNALVADVSVDHERR